MVKQTQTQIVWVCLTFCGVGAQEVKFYFTKFLLLNAIDNITVHISYEESICNFEKIIFISVSFRVVDPNNFQGKCKCRLIYS